MESGTLLKDRYRIQEKLGEGRLASTFVAIDEQTADRCVVKQLSVESAYSQSTSEVGTVSGSESAKIVELFQREGKILAHLDHPGIPKFIDSFTIAAQDDTRLYMVQEYVEARNLGQLIDEGRHFTEKEVVRIARQVTGILEYLHGRSPPLIHRDIKPSNVLLGDGGDVFLVDFGAVKTRLALDGLDGSTIVGTYSYMPLEQYQANAVPASDIYSLGMTLIAVLSHKDPSEIERRDNRLDFQRHVHVSKRLAVVLERMVEPNLERRYRAAAEVKHDLKLGPVRKRRTPKRQAIATAVVSSVAFVLAGVGIVRLQTARSSDPVQPGAAAPSTPSPRSPVPANETPAVVARDGVLHLDIYKQFRYVETGWPMGLSVSQSEARLDTSPFERLRAEPRYGSRQVLYGYLPMGNGSDTRITFVVDELDRPTWVAYVDRNNNEDLTDDGPPIVNEGTGKFAAQVSVAVDVVMASGETEQRPYNLWVWVNEPRGEDKSLTAHRARFYARCHYAGRVDLGNEVFAAVAYEYNRHNALFAENGVWIDLNRDGEVGDDEHFLHGEMVRVGGADYRISLDYP